MGFSRLVEEGLAQDKALRQASEDNLRALALRLAADPDYHERGKPYPFAIAKRANTTAAKVKKILKAAGISWQAREQWGTSNGKSAELRRKKRKEGR